MGSVCIDMIGQHSGRLVVTARAPGIFSDRKARWICHCECGGTTILTGRQIRQCLVRSCGCLRDEAARARMTTHGAAYSRAYISWGAAKTRCFNPNVKGFRNYGARGITMAPQWRDDFRVFYAEMGDCPPRHTLERIDNERGYEPGNCKWATRQQQAQNRRANRMLTLNGLTLSTAEWERRLGFHPGTVKRRLQRGWSALRALTAPLR